MLLITTSVVNNPLFIEMQYMTLKKFVKNPFKYVVYNDAKSWKEYSNHYDENVRNDISSLCSKLNIECININNEHHKNLNETNNPSTRAAESCNHMLKDHIESNTKTIQFDSDMFLIDYLDIEEKYKECELAIIPQHRVDRDAGLDINYAWNGLVYFDMPLVKNKHLLNWGLIPHADSGGAFHNYFINTPDASMRKINHLSSGTWNKNDFPENINKNILNFLENDPKNVNGKYFAELYDDIFLHYRAGGNWMLESKELHDKRTKLLWDSIVSII